MPLVAAVSDDGVASCSSEQAQTDSGRRGFQYFRILACGALPQAVMLAVLHTEHNRSDNYSRSIPNTCHSSRRTDRADSIVPRCL